MSQAQEMFIGMIIELVVMIIAVIILSLIRKKYMQKRHRYTLLLFYIFTCFLVAIFFTWLSKVIQLFGNFEYANLSSENVPDPLTLESFFILRIIEYRFTFIAFVIGAALSYILRVNLFDNDYKIVEKRIIYIFGLFIIVFQIFFYSKSISILGLIAYLLLLFYIILIFIPFTSRCIKSYRGIEEMVYKKGFLSLIIMSLAICSILIFNMIDVVYIVLYNTSYTVFYYIHLASIIIGYLGAYFGYIKPRTAI